MPKDPEAKKEQLFYKLKPIKPTCIPSLDYIRLVTEEEHHNYYLKWRFD
jgi:hypothetical protein